MTLEVKYIRDGDGTTQEIQIIKSDSHHLSHVVGIYSFRFCNIQADSLKEAEQALKMLRSALRLSNMSIPPSLR